MPNRTVTERALEQTSCNAIIIYNFMAHIMSLKNGRHSRNNTRFGVQPHCVRVRASLTIFKRPNIQVQPHRNPNRSSRHDYSLVYRTSHTNQYQSPKTQSNSDVGSSHRGAIRDSNTNQSAPSCVAFRGSDTTSNSFEYAANWLSTFAHDAYHPPGMSTLTFSSWAC